MKRILILVVTLLFGLTLAACENFTQVQEFSREYCEENPTADVCKLDINNNLTEIEILQLFNGVIENYNNVDYANFCDEFFSVTNPDLLDQCRTLPDQLLPDGFGGFSSITYDATASNNYYVITGITSDGLQEVEFKVQVVIEEGSYMISYWVFTSTPIEQTCDPGYVLENGSCVLQTQTCPDGQIWQDGECKTPTVEECPVGQILVDGECLPDDPLEQTVSEEEAVIFLQDFIDMYLNPDIASDAFCNEYFVFDPEGCIDDREEGHSLGATISLDNVVDLGDGIFGAEMTFFDYPEATGESNYQKFLLTKDDEGNILIEFVDNRVPLDVAGEFFKQLLADYLDTTISIEDLAFTYFMGEIPGDLVEERNETIANGIEYISQSWYQDENGEYVMKFTVVHSEGTEDVEVPFMVYEYEPGMYVIEIFDDNPYDMEQEEYLYAFINDYQNPDILSEDFCPMYFGPEVDAECINERDESLANPDFFVEILHIDYRDGMLIVGIEVFDGISDEFTEVAVEFIYDEFGIAYLKFHDYMVDPEQENFIIMLVQDYGNPDIPSDQYCMMYFGPDAEFDCVEERNEALASTEFWVELMHIYYQDGMMHIKLEMFDGQMQEIMEATVEFIYDENGIAYVRFHGDMVDPEQENFIIWMIESYTDPSMTSEEWCNTFFGPMDYDMCMEDREFDLTNPDFGLYLEWIDFRDGMMVIGLQMFDGQEQHYQELAVHFIYDDFGIWYVEFDEFYHQNPDEIIFLEEMFATYLDPNWTSQEWCNAFFGPEQEESCVMDRDETLNNPDAYVVLDWWSYEYGGMIIGVSMYDGFEGKYEEMFVEFVYDEMGIMYIRFHPAYQHNQEWEDFVYDMINQFNDYSIPNADICYYFFEGENADRCIEKREKMIAENGQVFIEYFHFGPYGNELGLHWMLQTEEYIEDLKVDFYYNEFNELKMHFEGRYHYDFPFDEAYSILEQVLADFSNPAISDEDFCYTWFPHFDNMYCFLERDKINNTTVNAWIDWMQYSPQGFIAKIVVELPDLNEAYHYEIMFAPYYDEFGALVIHWWYPFYGYEYEQVENLLIGFFFDAIDDSVTTHDLYNMYSRGDFSQFDEIHRILQSIDFYDFSIRWFNFHGWDGDLEIEFYEVNGETYIYHFWVNFYDFDGMMLMDISLDSPHNDFPEHEAKMHLEWVINMFNDPAVPNEDACMYIAPFMMDCFSYRDEMFAGGYTLELVGFWREFDNGFGADIQFTDFETGNPVIFYYSLVFWYNSDMTIHMEIHTPYPNHHMATYEEAYDLWMEWVFDYQDATFLNQDFADKWFMGHYQEDFFYGRDQELAAGITYTVIDFIDDQMHGPDFYRFIIERNENGNVSVQEDYVLFRIFDDGTFTIEFLHKNDPMIDFEKADMIMNMFFTDLRDQFYTAQEVCVNYMLVAPIEHCEFIVNELFRAYSDFDYYYFEQRDGHFVMGVDFYDQNGMLVHYTDFAIYFYQDNGVWYFDMHEIFDPFNEYEAYFIHLDMMQLYLEDAVNNFAVTPEFCEFYFQNDALCGNFNEMLNTELLHIFVTDYWYEMDEYGVVEFFVDLHFDYNDGSFIMVEYLVEFTMDEAGIIRATLIEEARYGSVPQTAVLMGYDMTFAVMQEFAIDYADLNVDHVALCHIYFNDFMMAPDCLDEREEFIQQGGIAALVSITEYMDSDMVPYYDAVFNLTVDGITETVNAQVRVYQLEDGRYYIEFMDMYDDYYIDLDMVYNRIFELMGYYNDENYTEAFICETFFGYGPGETGCEPDRETMFQLGSALVLHQVMEAGTNEYGEPVYWVHFEYLNPDPNLSMEFEVYFVPFFDEDGNIYFTYAPIPMP